MSQHNHPGLEISDNLNILHHRLPQSSLDSQTPRTDTSGSGGPPEPPRRRPPTTGGFGSNNELPSELIQLDHDLLVVNGRRRNGLILFKPYHAEFAGPGAAVGGIIDRDCQGALPLGNFSLLPAESHEERQRGYALRRQWIRLIRQITENPVPLQRAQMILNQFQYYFDPDTIAQLPDEVLALVVGVLPHTIRMARSMKE